MTLDETEKLADDVFKRNASSKFGDPRYSCRIGSDELFALLTAIRTVMPVARAAEEWDRAEGTSYECDSDYWTAGSRAHIALRDAVDKMRTESK